MRHHPVHPDAPMTVKQYMNVIKTPVHVQHEVVALLHELGHEDYLTEEVHSLVINYNAKEKGIAWEFEFDGTQHLEINLVEWL